jgi:hypothetical protein
MSEDNISTRAAKKAFRDLPLRVAVLPVILEGLVLWGIGALICSLLHVSSYYALAIALFLTVMGWRDVRKHRELTFIGYLVEELETSLKGHFDGKLRSVEERLGELDKTEVLTPPSRTAPRSAITELAPAWQSSFRMEDQHGGDVKIFIEDAIKDVGATSPNQMGAVIKAVRVRLAQAGVDCEERVLSDLVRSRLQIEQ